MSKSVGVLLAVFAAAQLGYATWLAGYRAGYDDGATKAWDNARAALMPRDDVAEPELTQLDRPALLAR